jgi:hypothetical protein
MHKFRSAAPSTLHRLAKSYAKIVPAHPRLVFSQADQRLMKIYGVFARRLGGAVEQCVRIIDRSFYDSILPAK